MNFRIIQKYKQISEVIERLQNKLLIKNTRPWILFWSFQDNFFKRHFHVITMLVEYKITSYVPSLLLTILSNMFSISFLPILCSFSSLCNLSSTSSRLCPVAIMALSIVLIRLSRLLYMGMIQYWSQSETWDTANSTLSSIPHLLVKVAIKYFSTRLYFGVYPGCPSLPCRFPRFRPIYVRA